MPVGALSYEEILISKPPHPIRTEQDAVRVREEIQMLLRRYPRAEGEEEYLPLLGHLLIAWEHGRYEAPSISGVQALRSMIEDNGLTQSALVGPVFASPSIVSEVLSGKRRLTLTHIQKLASFFHTSPAIFLS